MFSIALIFYRLVVDQLFAFSLYIECYWHTDYALVPRVLFDGWSASDFKGLFSSEDEIDDMLEALTQVLVENNFDGAVIELWSQLPRKKSK